MTTVTVHSPAQVAEPRGARAAVAIVMAVIDAFAHLRRGFAQRRDFQRRVIEANELRAYARQVGARDLGFAADLRAAADRHELG
jgi:hypothetical protein